MENQGKEVCEYLKTIRKHIANENGIKLEERECHYDGPCKGTCPRCDAELQQLENAISKRGKLSKVALLAGFTISLAASCTATEGDVVSENELYGDDVYPEDSTQCPNKEKASIDYEAIDFNM
ncbi:MAG: hypothetical protein K6D59_08475 [Bacteroidales bacterium]|nr:hypothetical protein [Bacteroidales bacterium]